jgi:polysaccharide biosynthesis/export protein
VLVRALDAQPLIEVNKIRGVVQVLGERWDRLFPIPDEEMRGVEQVATAQQPVLPYPYLKEGQRARIAGGPLIGLEGILVEVKPRQALLVLSVGLLQRSVAVAIDGTAVTDDISGHRTTPMTTCPSLAMTRMARVTVALMAVILLGITLPARAQDDRTRGPDQTRYQVKRGDVLDLQFPFVPDFNQTATVQPDGFITLRVVGALRAERLTVPELTQRVRAEYASILRDPTVTIALTEFEKPYFIVAGEVEKPGKYDLRGETTATQALAVAGGLKERAKHDEAALFRRLPGGGLETTRLNLKKMLKEGQFGTDLRLQTGDMLFIPQGRQKVKISDITSTLWILPWIF